MNVFNENRRYPHLKEGHDDSLLGKGYRKNLGFCAVLLVAPMLAELIIERLIDEFSTKRIQILSRIIAPLLDWEK